MSNLLTADDPARTGVLIAFEGIDGCGKSTQARMLGEWLRERGVDILFTFEPTDGKFGQELRRSFSGEERLIPRRELELFVKDRQEHVNTLLLPGLAKKRVILLDRYYYSSMAYQGSMGYKSPDEIYAMMTAFSPVPDVTLLFEISTNTSHNRITRFRNDDPNLMERVDNLERVKKVFEAMDLPEIVRVSANGSKEEVFEQVLAIVKPVISKVVELD